MQPFDESARLEPWFRAISSSAGPFQEGGAQMTTEEIAFLLLVAGAFGAFIVALAYGSWCTSSVQRMAEGKSESSPKG